VAEYAVLVLDGPAVVGPLQERLGVTVRSTTAADHLEVAAELSPGVGHLVGLSVAPWPRAADLHAQGSAQLGSYTGVVSWHALPALADRLAEVAAPGVAAGAHLLVTAPDPGPSTEPEDLVFLRELAEALEARLTPSSRSIAWRGGSRQPTAVEALRTVVEAHGRRDVVEVPVAPGTSADPDLQAVGEELGARLTCVDLGRETLVDLLVEVVATVASHEGLA
jgi:hypothetical protein